MPLDVLVKWVPMNKRVSPRSFGPLLKKGAITITLFTKIGSGCTFLLGLFLCFGEFPEEKLNLRTPGSGSEIFPI